MFHKYACGYIPVVCRRDIDTTGLYNRQNYQCLCVDHSMVCIEQIKREHAWARLRVHSVKGHDAISNSKVLHWYVLKGHVQPVSCELCHCLGYCLAEPCYKCFADILVDGGISSFDGHLRDVAKFAGHQRMRCVG